jgi:hypothetical protein
MNTPFHKVFPIGGGALKCCLGCCFNVERRKAKMTRLREVIANEETEQNQRIDEIFDQNKVEFTG